MTLFSRTDESFLGQWWWTVDRALLGALIILIVFGVVLVSTASPPVAVHLGLGPYHFFKKHLVFLVPTLVCLLGCSMLTRRQIWRLGTFMLAGACFLMIMALVTGMEIKGARRWIHVAGVSLQPSEFLKPAFIIVSAWLMSLQVRGQIKGERPVPGHIWAAALYFIVIVLLLLQPDLGMSFVVTCGWAAQIFLAGLPLRFVFILLLAGIISGLCVYFAFDHVQSRINRFLDPASGDNFQVEKSLEAFQSGGFLGAGPGQGHIKNHLPDSHADFIIAVAAEEMGLVFVLAILAVYGFILWRGYRRLMHFHDVFVLLAAGGLLSIFGLQALIHFGSALNILPAKGMTLPFISYGGSSLLSMGITMGLVLALIRRSGRTSVSKSGLSLFKR